MAPLHSFLLLVAILTFPFVRAPPPPSPKLPGLPAPSLPAPLAPLVPGKHSKTHAPKPAPAPTSTTAIVFLSTLPTITSAPTLVTTSIRIPSQTTVPLLQTSTQSQTTESSDSQSTSTTTSSTGLSNAAKAGIGIGVTLLVILVVAGGALEVYLKQCRTIAAAERQDPFRDPTPGEMAELDYLGHGGKRYTRFKRRRSGLRGCIGHIGLGDKEGRFE